MSCPVHPPRRHSKCPCPPSSPCSRLELVDPRPRHGVVAPMPTLAEILNQYECNRVLFSGDANASFERHLVLDHVIDQARAHPRQKFEALAASLRDLLSPRWIATRKAHNEANPKRVYYLSMEFLIGRSLTNNVTNLMVDPLVREVMGRE